MSFERHEIRQQVGIGTKLVLIGGILFVIAFAAHGSQPSLGFEEQKSVVFGHNGKFARLGYWMGMPWSSCRQLARIERSGQNALGSKSQVLRLNLMALKTYKVGLILGI